jgi:hypothetical protein
MNNAAFHFGNLCADALRCARALENGDTARYKNSLIRARKTLSFLRTMQRPEAYEEGLLLMRALDFARESGAESISRDIESIRIPAFSAI